MQVRSIDGTFEAVSDVLGFIDDWYDLGALLGIQPRILSYVLRNKKQHEPGTPDSVYSFWREGDRVGYYSEGSLKFIQSRLALLLNGVYSMIPDAHKDCIWAYMSGMIVTRKLADFEKRKYLIKLDIKKYYDTITFKHIKETLMHYGCTERGAKLVTRYLTVKRPGVKNGPTTLQQGSKVSPMVSNIVGYHFFDRPLLAYFDEQRIKYPKLDIRYGRYCDNFGISLDGEIPIDFIRDLQVKITEIIRDAGFRYHKWQVVPCNHPTANQFFLGIVVNHRRRLDKAIYDPLRAALFSAVTCGVRYAAIKHFESNPPPQLEDFANEFSLDCTRFKADSFISKMTGKVAYLKHINADHYIEVKKLLMATKLLTHMELHAYHFRAGSTDKATLSPSVFNVAKHYRNKAQSVDDYLKELIDSIPSIEFASACLVGTKFAHLVDFEEQCPEHVTA